MRRRIEMLRELWQGDAISRGVVLWVLGVSAFVGMTMGVIVVVFILAVIA